MIVFFDQFFDLLLQGENSYYTSNLKTSYVGNLKNKVLPPNSCTLSLKLCRVKLKIYLGLFFMRKTLIYGDLYNNFAVLGNLYI